MAVWQENQAVLILPKQRDFFVSYNSLHSDGRIPMCKDCIRNACYNDDGEFEIESFQSLLRQLDKPFIQKLWNKSVTEVKKNTGSDDVSEDAVVGKYIKNISMQQHRSKTWKDSNFNDNPSAERGIETARRKSMNADKVYYLSDEDFIVTEDVIRLFGEGYTAKEYETMKRIYDDSKEDLFGLQQKRQLQQVLVELLMLKSGRSWPQKH